MFRDLLRSITNLTFNSIDTARFIVPLALVLGGFAVGFIFEKTVLRWLRTRASKNYWYSDDIIFDSTTGGLDADSGLKESTELLRILVKEVLVDKCGYAPRDVVIFGFGQGGMVALSTARKS